MTSQWIPKGARYFTAEREGNALKIEFFKPLDLTHDLVGSVRNVSELPGLLTQVDQINTRINDHA